MPETARGFDYVIVGAGAAGSALAARLTENPEISVVLIEAGGDHRPADVPAAFQGRAIDLDMDSNPDYWWHGLKTRRNPQQEIVAYQAGRGTGGTSQVNGLFAIRGVPADFSRWVALGAADWSWEDVLPYYRKLENDLDFGDAPYHGNGGPLSIYREPQQDWGGVDIAFRDSVLDLGNPWHEDVNAPDSTGLSPFPMHVHQDGRRSSANDGYLEPARGRANLMIRGNTLADRIVFAPGTRRATGVRLADGEIVSVNPGGEVILCAGGALSPAMLVRSGIGPAAELTRLGVEVVADLPVGQDLTEHPFLLVNLPVAAEFAHSPYNRTVNAAWRYTSGIGDTGPNDMMVIPNNNWVGLAGLCIWQQHAVSRGKLVFESLDPTTGPLVDYGMLTDDVDLQRAKDALDRVHELVDRPAFKRILDGKPEIPSLEEMPKTVMSSHHLTTTVRMGRPEDATTVVDTHCRVLGTEGLRVIDQSIMPELVKGNTLLTTLMIAERMADRLKGSAA